MFPVKPASRLRVVSAAALALSLLAAFQIASASAPRQSQPAPAAPKPSEVLHSALSQVSETIVSLNISRWKAPGEVRAATQQNVDSIQRDLNSTLPGLLSPADAAPGSISAVFPVYRNIDALYDVLLRVSQTANLAAPENEAASVANALKSLESARNDLGNAILAASKSSEAETARLQSVIQQAEARQAAAPPKTTIVDDGPVKSTSSTKRKKKSASTPTTGSTQPQP